MAEAAVAPSGRWCDSAPTLAHFLPGMFPLLFTRIGIYLAYYFEFNPLVNISLIFDIAAQLFISFHGVNMRHWSSV